MRADSSFQILNSTTNSNLSLPPMLVHAEKSPCKLFAVVVIVVVIVLVVIVVVLKLVVVVLVLALEILIVEDRFNPVRALLALLELYGTTCREGSVA